MRRIKTLAAKRRHSDATSPAGSAGRGGPGPAFAAGLALLVMTTGAYLPATRGEFIWDDIQRLGANEDLRSLEGLGRIWRPTRAPGYQYYPLVQTSFWLEYRLWGLGPSGYHAVNIALHALGSVLLWRVLRGLEAPGAWAAAALFALHPVHVESVAWITERKNVLSGVFYFGAAWALLRWSLGSARGARGVGSAGYYMAGAFLFVCALLSKTATCTLPAALLLVLWWRRKRLAPRDFYGLAPLFVLGLALASLTIWLETHHVGAAGETWNLSWIQRGLLAGRAICFYSGKLLWPAGLTFIYPRWSIDASVWWQYLFPGAAAAVVAAAWALRKRLGSGPWVALLYYVGTLAPVLGLFNIYFMRYSFVADHFQYLASVGPIALGAAAGHYAACRLGGWGRGGAALLLAGVLGAFGVLTWRQTGVYLNQETLWRQTLQNNPEAWMAHDNLGALLLARGKTDQAVSHFRQALRINPNDAEAHSNLGHALLTLGRTQEAVWHSGEALRLAPDFAEAHLHLGNALLAQGQTEQAADHYRQALAIAPDFVHAHFNLGLALRSQGKLEEAMECYRHALRIDPEYVEARNALGNALLMQRRTDEAIACYRRVLEIAPTSARAHCNLGIALTSQGKLDDAAGHLRRALELDPTYVNARYNLGIALRAQGRLDDAVEAFRETLRLDPAHKDAHQALDAALAERAGQSPAPGAGD